MLIQTCCFDQTHKAEPARVVVSDPGAISCFEHHMGVLRLWVRRKVKFARPDDALRLGDFKPAAHAQVHNQGLAAIQVRQQVFGAAPQGDDLGASQSLNKTFREWKPEVRTPSFNPSKSPPFQNGGEAPPDGFNFGKLRHEA